MAKYKKLSVHTESCHIVNAASFHLFVPMIKHSKNYEQFYFQYRPQAWRSTWRRSTTGVETSPASTATRVLPKATHSRSTSWQSTPTTSATPGTNTGKNFIYYILLPHWTKARLYLSKVCFVINDFQLLVNGKAHSCTHLRKSLQNGSSCPIEQKARLFLSNVFIIRDLQLLVNDKAVV